MNTILLPLKSLIPNAKNKQSLPMQDTRSDNLRCSIARDGLLNPLIVAKQKNKYVVIDGNKRLKVLQKLAKTPLFTRSLYKIPCLISTDVSKATQARKRPQLLSEAELVHIILRLVRKGHSDAAIADRYKCELTIVQDAKTLPLLHADVLKRFYDSTINLNQAAALATIPHKTAQLNLLLQLGPFVSDRDIIMAIKAGETVLELPDENILIVPSRTPKAAWGQISLEKPVGALTHRLAA